MRFRVVGSSAAVPREGGACSCYLFETASARIIADCGTGALSQLRRYLEPDALDAVAITHFHPDHVFDLVPLRYQRAFSERMPPPLPVFVQPGGTAALETLALATRSKDGERFFDRSMRPAEFDPDGTLQVGDLSITFAKGVHYIDSYALRVECGRTAIVYSGDTAPCESLTRLAREATLFVCECSLGSDGRDREPRGHSSAREAGRMAREASAAQLLLTHYDQRYSPAELRQAAAQEYDGPIDVADDGWCRTFGG